MKNFIIFMGQNSKVLMSTIGVIVCQVLKLIGIQALDENELNKLMDALSVLFGLFGLFFAARGEWPTNTPPTASTGKA